MVSVISVATTNSGNANFFVVFFASLNFLV